MDTAMTEVLHRAPAAEAVNAMFAGGSEMGALMRSHNWSASPLGAPETWPQSLRSVVGLLLGSKFPMFVAWGEELGFLYNDAYVEVLGAKHPNALGRRFYDVWSEVWPDITPFVDAAMAGEATWREDLPLLVNRNGFDEETWFTFSYSPVRDENGKVAGLFCSCTETTANVIAARRQHFQEALDLRLQDLDDLEEVVVAASELLARELGAAQVGYARVEDDERHVFVKGEWSDGRIACLKGRHDLLDCGPAFVAALQSGAPLQVADVELDDRTNPDEALSAYSRIGAAACMNVPLLKKGRLVANVFAHAPEPRTWSNQEVELAHDMAQRVWLTLERVRARSTARDTDKRYRMAALATNDAIWDWDLRDNSVLWNEALYTAYRYTPDQVEFTGEWWISRIHPEDRDKVDQSIHAVIDGREEHWTEEYRFVRGDGSFADVLDRGYVFRSPTGKPVRMIGAMLDLTQRKQSQAALRSSDELLRFALDAGGLGAWELNLRTRALTTSPQCREIFGKRADEPFSHEALLESVHPDDRERREAAVRAAIEEGKDYNIDYRVIWPNGQIRWINVRGRLAYDESGMPERMAGVSLDVTHRTLANEHQRMLIDELNHRVKNTLAIIQSIAVQTFKAEDGNGAPPEQRELFESRLMALAKAHDVLTRANWEGARLRDVVFEVIAVHSGGDDDAFEVRGQDARLTPKMALSLSMALHELCTNATKYGALSVPDGRVSIFWTVEKIDAGRCLRLEWREEGGPPVATPSRKGFGSRLIERQLARELRGEVTLTFAPKGVTCSIVAPVAEPASGRITPTAQFELR